MGATGATGATGAAGAAGATGATGATGVVATAAFSGLVSSLAANAANWVFAGPTATLTVAPGQRLTGAATAVLALNAGGPYTNTAFFSHSLCYQTSGGTVTSFVGFAYVDGTISTTRFDYSTAATVAPGFAVSTSVTVGFCVMNQSSGIVGNNDYVNGYVQVTN
jgi:collagen type I/II/III/V/XI/XXIV/XXVII alpha